MPAANIPPIHLAQHFVAFLDVLGFTEMVKQDIVLGTNEFLMKLFRCHQSASQVFQHDPSCGIIQFSDSIVVWRPYDATRFVDFLDSIAKFQRLLLNEELVCRGGIAVNKHFNNGTFTFSAGLIDAYKVESKSAKYPRVVVATDVVSMLYPNLAGIPDQLIAEDDGLHFVDYLGITKKDRPQELKKKIGSVCRKLVSDESSSVREKGLWLAEYSDFSLKTKLSGPRFSLTKKRIRKAL